MKKLILIKYGELTTKKDNRNFFVKKLTENIEKQLKNYEIKIIKTLSRMYIEINNEDLEKIIEKLKKIFGIHSIVICDKVNTNKEEIEKKVLEKLKTKQFKTFKIETKRSDKNFPISSIEFSKKIGAYVLKNINTKVDVHNPDILIKIEIRKEATYIYTDEIKGLGGYPVSVQGKGLLMLSGGIDSPVAGYLALKRGVDLECLYFESPPHTSIEAKNKVIKLANIINEYSLNIKIHIINFTKIQEEIYKKVDDNYIITIMRRMMYRIAEKIKEKRDLKVIINGESIGQVASQTLTSIVAINEVISTPVIRPVACLDKLEIIEIANKIGTYKTSILPFEDCCTIFVPKHPIINPSIKKCLLEEAKINYQELIEEAINNIETIDILQKEKSDIL